MKKENKPLDEKGLQEKVDLLQKQVQILNEKNEKILQRIDSNKIDKEKRDSYLLSFAKEQKMYKPRILNEGMPLHQFLFGKVYGLGQEGLV